MQKYSSIPSELDEWLCDIETSSQNKYAHRTQLSVKHKRILMVKKRIEKRLRDKNINFKSLSSTRITIPCYQ